MRTVEGPGWKMIHGDCLDVLAAMPDKSVHVTLTDPPYEVEAHTEGRRQMTGSRGIAENPLTFAAIDSVDRFTAAAQFARVTTNRVLAFCQAEAIAPWRDALDAAGIPYRRAIPWCKPDAMPSLHGRWPGQAWEAIVLAQHPSSPPCPVGGKSRIYEFMRCNNGKTPNLHQTQKPLGLMVAMVEDFTDPGDIVLDPFMGSGTTAAVALQHGRQYMGCELNPDYQSLQQQHIAAATPAPAPAAPQIDLFQAA